MNIHFKKMFEGLTSGQDDASKRCISQHSERNQQKESKIQWTLKKEKHVALETKEICHSYLFNFNIFMLSDVQQKSHKPKIMVDKQYEHDGG